MPAPIKNQIKCVFIPVSNIYKARDWYCKILQLPSDGEIIFEHLFVLSMQGTAGVVLDSKIYAPDKVFKMPVIQFSSDNIEHSFNYLRENGVELITDIENGHWFNFKDPDGNILMVCQ